MISINLVNFLILQTSVSFTDPTVVGDPNYPTYNGRQVILTTATLQNFTAYMNGLSLSFTYDHAALVSE